MINIPGTTAAYKLLNNIYIISFEVAMTAITSGTTVLNNLPRTKNIMAYSIGMANGANVPCLLDNSGTNNSARLSTYHPGHSNAARIDATIIYVGE